MIDYSTIPDYTLESLQRWTDQGIPTGGFLQAVLEHDLFEAYKRGDDQNLAALHSIVSFIYNELPSNCHGSKADVLAWYKRHREQREAESGSH